MIEVNEKLEHIEESENSNKNLSYVMDEKAEEMLKTKIEEIMEICQIYRIPFFFTAAVCNDNGITKYMNMLYSSKANGIYLDDDQVEKHILIANGFTAVPKREALELDMQELAKFETRPIPETDEEE